MPLDILIFTQFRSNAI